MHWYWDNKWNSIHIDNSQIITGVFLDLAKAFYTVNHSILITKLEAAGIRGMALIILAVFFDHYFFLFKLTT